MKLARLEAHRCIGNVGENGLYLESLTGRDATTHRRAMMKTHETAARTF